MEGAAAPGRRSPPGACKSKAKHNEVSIVDLCDSNWKAAAVASKKRSKKHFEVDLCAALDMLELGPGPVTSPTLHGWGGVIQLPEDAGLTKFTAAKGPDRDLAFSFLFRFRHLLLGTV